METTLRKIEEVEDVTNQESGMINVGNRVTSIEVISFLHKSKTQLPDPDYRRVFKK